MKRTNRSRTRLQFHSFKCHFLFIREKNRHFCAGEGGGEGRERGWEERVKQIYSNQLFIRNVDCWHLTIEICFSPFIFSSLFLHYTGNERKCFQLSAFNDPQIKTRQWESKQNKKTTTESANRQTEKIDWNWIGNVRCEKWETSWRRKKKDCLYLQWFA